ncbi:MAG: hypothetical protein ACO3LE_06045 [Bdellovibrionota bacterium]
MKNLLALFLFSFTLAMPSYAGMKCDCKKSECQCESCQSGECDCENCDCEDCSCKSCKKNGKKS